MLPTNYLSRRLKLSNDPNNTKWTNDTSNFGHKIMRSQGWQPGEYLGARDARHAEFHTQANASHVRVSLKDDTLGLGAKKGSGVEQGECVGLDVFKSLLGRLNSTDEDEYVKEQRKREELRNTIYREHKWATIRFVSGGYLVGDKIKDVVEDEAKRVRESGQGSARESSESSSSESDSESESESTPEPAAKKSKKSKKGADAEAGASDAAELASKESRREKKRKASSEDADDKKSKRSKEEKKEKKARKQEKKAKKQEKKEKKEKKKEKGSSESSDADSKHGKKDKKEKKDKSSKRKSKSKDDDDSKDSKKSKRSRDEAEAPERPAPSAAPRPIMLSGRHAGRARNIEQKRQAAMQSASLNEVNYFYVRVLGDMC